MSAIYERLTERARQVMVLATEEAVRNHNSHIGIPHLVVGLIKEGEGVASQVLEAKGITLKDVSCSFEGLPFYATRTEPPVMGAAAKEALELALREALSLGHNYIGTEHILLGIVRLQEKDPEHSAHLPSDIRDGVLEALQGKPKHRQKVETDARKEDKLEDAFAQIIKDGETLFRSFMTAVTLIKEKL